MRQPPAARFATPLMAHSRLVPPASGAPAPPPTRFGPQELTQARLQAGIARSGSAPPPIYWTRATEQPTRKVSPDRTPGSALYAQSKAAGVTARPSPVQMCDATRNIQPHLRAAPPWRPPDSVVAPRPSAPNTFASGINQAPNKPPARSGAPWRQRLAAPMQPVQMRAWSSSGTPATIQREIDPRDPRGPAGSDLLGRFVRNQHGEMGFIREYQLKSNAYGISKSVDGEVEFYVVGTDPYWRVVSDDAGGYLYKFARRENPKNMMSLKTHILQDENKIDYKLENGKMFDLDGQLLNPKGESLGKPNVVSFVITQNMDLLIGYGHTGLSKGHTVIAAGTMTIKDGVASYYGNESGHYFPQGLEEVRGIKYMHKCFPWIKVPSDSVGRWLPDDIGKSKYDVARQSMIDILLETDKNKRQKMKEVWPNKL